EPGNAEIHQGESDGAPGAAGTDLHDRRAPCAVASQPFYKTAAETGAVEIVACGPAVGRDRDRVHRADLRSFRVDGIEQVEDVLLERVGNVRSGKARDPDRGEQLRQAALGPAIDIDQMI